MIRFTLELVGVGLLFLLIKVVGDAIDEAAFASVDDPEYMLVSCDGESPRGWVPADDEFVE